MRPIHRKRDAVKSSFDIGRATQRLPVDGHIGLAVGNLLGPQAEFALQGPQTDLAKHDRERALGGHYLARKAEFLADLRGGVRDRTGRRQTDCASRTGSPA